MADSRETNSLLGGNVDSGETTERGSADNPNHLRVVGDEPWVMCEAVAKACGISTKTIYRLSNAGIGFPSIPFGREKRYVISEVKAFIRANPERIAQAAAAHTLKSHKGAKR